MIIGHTPGGAPIYFGPWRALPKRNKNRRYSCSCGHKTTKGQLKRNGGVCWQCKKPMKAAQEVGR